MNLWCLLNRHKMVDRRYEGSKMVSECRRRRCSVTCRRYAGINPAPYSVGGDSDE